METNCLDYFGDRLKLLRRERGITQQELADAIGISKGGLCYYENTNRAPDITVLEKFADYFKVSADYLLGRTNAQTQKAKLQAVCNFTGLSDTAVKLLAELKENSPQQLQAVNFLLEQAAGDMDIVYPLDDTDNYEGSILNAVVRYLSRYHSYDEYLMDALSSTDEGISSEIQSAIQQLVLNQAVTALKKGVREMVDYYFQDTQNDD